MGYPVQQLRDLLKLAASLRNLAAESSCAEYGRRLLLAAAELESQAEYLATHRPDEIPPQADENENAALHAPIDLRV